MCRQVEDVHKQLNPVYAINISFASLTFGDLNVQVVRQCKAGGCISLISRYLCRHCSMDPVVRFPT